MGIIISSFIGCGKTYLTNINSDKIKIFDASDINKESIVNEVMGNVDKYDIVFIPSDKEIRSLFDEQNIDYDLFYPSDNRRGEFIENQVRKRNKPDIIRNLDKNFNEWIQEIDNSEATNCYKHKLSNFGEYIGNDYAIMQYIDSITNKNNGDNNKTN